MKGKDYDIYELHRKLNDHGWEHKNRLYEAQDLNKKLIEFYVKENTKLRKSVRDWDADIKVKNRHSRQDMT